MKDHSENQSEAAPEMTTMATDLADAYDPKMAQPYTPASLENFPGVPANQSAATPEVIERHIAPDQQALVPQTGPTSWVGAFSKKILDAFLSSKREELKDFQGQQLERHQCQSQFNFFTKSLGEWKLKLDDLRSRVENYKSVDIARTLFENCFSRGHTFDQIFSVNSFSPILTAYMIKTHGDQVMALAEAEYGALQKKFSDFKREKRNTLIELGLI